MRVIVTGAAGHLGSRLVAELLNRGVQVTGVDCLLHGGEGLLSTFSHPDFTFLNMDLRSDGLDAAGEGDCVVHLAAMVGPICDKDPDRAWETNLRVTSRICDWANVTGTKLLFASTCSNYGIADGEATEDSPLKPLGTYAETKVAGENLVARLEDQAVTLRFGTLAGLSPRPRFDTLLNQLCYEAINDGRIECYQPGARRPFAHVSDAAGAVATVIQDWDRVARPCYNVVGFNITKRQLAEAVRDRTGCEIVDFPESADRRDYAVSDQAIRGNFGWRPRYDVAACVEEMCSALELEIVKPRKEHYNA